MRRRFGEQVLDRDRPPWRRFLPQAVAAAPAGVAAVNDDNPFVVVIGDLRGLPEIPGRGKLKIPPDIGAGIWQNGCGAGIELIRKLPKNS